MSNSTSNKKIVNSMLWVAVEKFGYSGLYFLSTIILARLLTPQDFGLIGLLAIFISVSQMLVESGLGSALVKKHEPTDKDYSTIFIFNFFISCLLYTLLFFSSSFIASYYNQPVLKDLARVLGIITIINSFTLIQKVHLIKELKFKRQSEISIQSLIVAIMTSFVYAYLGYGVWALVAHQVIYSYTRSYLMFCAVQYKPQLIFSSSSFKELYGFGGKLFLSSLIQIIYNDIFAIIIAKLFNIVTTGLYYQAKKLVDFPVSVFRALVDNASFPILSKIQDRKEFFIMASKINRAIITIAFPMLLAIPLFSESIILIVLGEKWKSAIPILEILSFGAVGLILESISRNVIKSTGRADLLLKSELIKKGLGFIILFSTISLGLDWILWGVVFTNIIGFMINTVMISKITLYTIRKQVKDILMPLLISLISCLVVYFLRGYFDLSLVFSFLIQGVILILIYIGLGFLLRINEFNDILKYFIVSKN